MKNFRTIFLPLIAVGMISIQTIKIKDPTASPLIICSTSTLLSERSVTDLTNIPNKHPKGVNMAI